jgi:hypothetical protein
MSLLRRKKGPKDVVRNALLRGAPIQVPCTLRRTSARGWGPWTPGVIDVGGLPDGEVRWLVRDPISVGFPITRGEVDEPFTDTTEVWLRPVRFQTEAFHGKDAEIVVVVSDWATIEIAVPKDDSGPLAERLDDLLLPH